MFSEQRSCFNCVVFRSATLFFWAVNHYPMSVGLNILYVLLVVAALAVLLAAFVWWNCDSRARSAVRVAAKKASKKSAFESELDELYPTQWADGNAEIGTRVHK
jgi:Flp pilus assembly protein TadB